MPSNAVRVVVRGLDHRVHGPSAVVELVEPVDGTRRRLDRSGDGLFYDGAAPAGRYLLSVVSGELSAPEREVVVGEEDMVSTHLGQAGWPFYRYGRDTIPFPPPEGLLAVAHPERVPTPDEASRTGDELIRRLDLRPMQVEDRPQRAGGAVDFRHANGAIWLFRLPDGADQADVIRQVTAIVRELDGDGARVGVPVDLRPGHLAVLDARVVVRFRDEMEREAARGKLLDAEARTIRELERQDRTLYLVELPVHPLAALEQLEEWSREQVLVYGEPDLMTQIVDDAFPAQPPDDPRFTDQSNLTLQRVDAAWKLLAAAAAGHPLGEPTVTVCTLDSGIELGHPDIGGLLTDGAQQIARTFDFSHMRDLTVPGYQPPTSHGMGVLGIIGARTDNGIGIAGIAPNTRQICLQKPELISLTYSEVLRWAAGLITGSTVPGWPAEPLTPGADIISCSHGRGGLAISSELSDTFDDLARLGRGGRGTIVIYSAGNDDTLITGYRTFAAYPTNIAVSNSMPPDATGVERRDPTSNYGPEIALCAQGTDVLSLSLGGGEQNFEGTSASAPTVAAVVALMLSRNPDLEHDEVRDILCATAVPIDTANNDPVGRWSGGFSQWYGHGRVDAEAAVVAAAAVNRV